MPSDNEPISGLLFGAIGGLAGLAAMRLYWTAAAALPGPDPRLRTSPKEPDVPMSEREVDEQQRRRRENLSALEEAPDHWDGDLDDETPRYQVPWSYGLVAGSAYGVLRGRVADGDAAGGLLLGAGLWALGDELIPVLFGLRNGRAVQPWKQHAHRLGAHLAYGAVTAAAVQGLYRMTEPPPTKRAAAAGALNTAWEGLKAYVQFKALKKSTGAGSSALGRLFG